MRLVCPNCDAQYEIPDDVMPPEGREVQCSNCSEIWFQNHPEQNEERPPSKESESRDEDQSVAEQPGETDEEHNDEADVFAFDEPERPSEPEKPSELEAKEENSAPRPTRRELDPSVAEVLRAEAELEEQARRNDAANIESQPELGLSDAQHRSEETHAPAARTHDEPADDTNDHHEGVSTEISATSTQSDLLPDIEKINSTLRSNQDRSPDEDPGQTAQVEVQEKRNARWGFTLTVALVAFLALLYVFSTDLSETFPSAAPMLSEYTAFIDSARNWLSAQTASILN